MKLIRIIKASDEYSRAYQYLVKNLGSTPLKYLDKLNYRKNEDIKLMSLYFKNFQKLTPELNNKLFKRFKRYTDDELAFDINDMKNIPNEYLLKMQDLILKKKIYKDDLLLVIHVFEKMKKNGLSWNKELINLIINDKNCQNDTFFEDFLKLMGRKDLLKQLRDKEKEEEKRQQEEYNKKPMEDKAWDVINEYIDDNYGPYNNSNSYEELLEDAKNCKKYLINEKDLIIQDLIKNKVISKNYDQKTEKAIEEIIKEVSQNWYEYVKENKSYYKEYFGDY